MDISADQGVYACDMREVRVIEMFINDFAAMDLNEVAKPNCVDRDRPTDRQTCRHHHFILIYS